MTDFKCKLKHISLRYGVKGIQYWRNEARMQTYFQGFTWHKVKR